MKLTKFLPIFTLGIGIPCLALRFWLFASGVDDRGLVSNTHPAGIISFVLIAVFLVLLFLATYPVKKTPEYDVLFPASQISFAGSCLAAAGVLFTAITEIPGSKGVIGLGTCIFGLLCAAMLVVAGWSRLKGNRPTYYLHALVTGYFMFHILSQYQMWNIEPQLHDYFPQLLASVFLMVTAYQRTALDAGSGKLGRCLFFQYGALFFSILSMKGDAPIFYLSMAIWAGTTVPRHRGP